MEGGVVSVTNRILVVRISRCAQARHAIDESLAGPSAPQVDMLNNMVPLEAITGLIVTNAHHVSEGSNEAFIARIFRQANTVRSLACTACARDANPASSNVHLCLCAVSDGLHQGFQRSARRAGRAAQPRGNCHEGALPQASVALAALPRADQVSHASPHCHDACWAGDAGERMNDAAPPSSRQPGLLVERTRGGRAQAAHDSGFGVRTRAAARSTALMSRCVPWASAVATMQRLLMEIMDALLTELKAVTKFDLPELSLENCMQRARRRARGAYRTACVSHAAAAAGVSHSILSSNANSTDCETFRRGTSAAGCLELRPIPTRRTPSSRTLVHDISTLKRLLMCLV